MNPFSAIKRICFVAFLLQEVRKMTKTKGRPCKLTEELAEKICHYISQGNYFDTSCKLVGIDYSTFRAWILKGEEDGRGKFHDFSESIKRAEAEAEAKRVEMILKAGSLGGDWKANAWYLERKYPERWGRVDRLEAHVKNENTNKQEYHIEQMIQQDPETIELVRQLWRRQQAVEGKE
jgi:transposase